MNVIDKIVARYINQRGGHFNGFGMGRINFNTCLSARKKVIDPETGLYIYTGDDRRVFGHVVTTAFVQYIVDNLVAELVAFGDFKFHDSGTGVVAENITDTTLGTPCGEARDVGTQVDGGALYTSVGTNTYAGPFAITEHGLFNIAVAGILMDRTVFGAINVVATNQIEFTFTITFTAGG